MQLIKRKHNPFVRKSDSTCDVMTDVIMALLPALLMTWVAYGFTPLMVVFVAIGSALVAEFLFDMFFNKDTRSLGDGSAIVTGMLLAFTIGPFTSLPVVAVGGATAVIFGKLLWGGIGRNRFNPALMGREFMVVLFPAVMNSTQIFGNENMARVSEIVIFDTGFPFWDRLFYYPVGAMGEYSPLLLILGGFFLLYRRRISWHIPLGMLATFTLLLFVFRTYEPIGFTIGGLLLGTLYMATDMPTSSSTPAGKIYFGVMIALLAMICLVMGAVRGYFSYAILLMNAFVVPINWVFRPRTWGHDLHLGTRLWQGALLTAGILAAVFALLWFHHADALIYPVMAIALYSVGRFALSYHPKFKNRLG